MLLTLGIGDRSTSAPVGGDVRARDPSERRVPGRRPHADNEGVSDVFAALAMVLPILVAVVLAARVIVLRRQASALRRALAEQRLVKAEESSARIRADHAAELSRTLHDDLGHRLTLASLADAIHAAFDLADP